MPAAGHRSEGGRCESWLVRSDEVLAALEAQPAGRVVRSPPAATLVLRRVALLRMAGSARGAPGGGADLAWCAAPGAGCRPGELEVRRLRTVDSGRPVLVRPGAGVVLLAGAGSFERWALRVGDRVALRGG